MGPGITAPPLPVEESTRSEISRENQGKTGQWDLNSIDDFIPERWLERDNAGKLRYNPNAGPNLAFSAGIRGCFGKLTETKSQQYWKVSIEKLTTILVDRQTSCLRGTSHFTRAGCSQL